MRWQPRRQAMSADGSSFVYFRELRLSNVKAFTQGTVLDLRLDGRPAPWTLIVGENGLGKTTLLQCLALLRPTLNVEQSSLFRLKARRPDCGRRQCSVSVFECMGEVAGKIEDAWERAGETVLPPLCQLSSPIGGLASFFTLSKRKGRIFQAQDRAIDDFTFNPAQRCRRIAHNAVGSGSGQTAGGPMACGGYPGKAQRIFRVRGGEYAPPCKAQILRP
jgi:hypothetical protein